MKRFSYFIFVVLITIIAVLSSGSRMRERYSSTGVESMISRWTMNDNAASAVVIDLLGSHNGTYKDVGGNLNTDTGDSSGRVLGSLDFDGIDEYVEITDHADFTPALTPFSISAWCNMDDATEFIIASKGIYNTTNAEWRFQTGTAAAQDKLFIRFHDESVASCHIGRMYDVAITSYEGIWIHIVATYDGGIVSSGCKIYLNGVRVDDIDKEADAGSFVAVENLGSAVWLGRYSTDYSSGKIDDVRIYSIELSPLQVQMLYLEMAGRYGGE